jgi:ERCC4-type nuclease
MTNHKRRDTRPYKIIIDIHEKDNPISRNLYDKAAKDSVELKRETPYDPTGDYIVIDRDGTQWGFERKSFLDCWQSICSGRIDGQLAQLEAKYPDHAILMLEAPTYFPKNLQPKTYIIKKTVMTFFNDRSLIMPCWYVLDSDHASNILIKFAKIAHRVEISGRGLIVVREDET